MKTLMHAILVLLAVLPLAQAADQVYVSSKKVKLYSTPGYNSEAVTRLNKGDALDLMASEGNWMQVRYQAMTGWVPRYSVSDTKPPAEVSFFSRLKSFFTSDSNRSRVTSISTAGGIRGLADGETESSGNKDYEALQEMENISVTEQEVETFVEGNKP